jgi:hypothetical protein
VGRPRSEQPVAVRPATNAGVLPVAEWHGGGAARDGDGAARDGGGAARDGDVASNEGARHFHGATVVLPRRDGSATMANGGASMARWWCYHGATAVLPWHDGGATRHNGGATT